MQDLPSEKPPEGPSPSNLSITELGLSARARNVLLEAGLGTVDDVLAAIRQGDDALAKLGGFGPKSLANLKARLQEQGFIPSSEPVVEDAPPADDTPRMETAMDDVPPVEPQPSITLAQHRHQLRFGVWIYGLIGVAVILLICSISLLTQLGITGHETLDAENSSVSHNDGLTLRVAPNTYTGRLRVQIESIPRLEFLEGSVGRALHQAANALPQHLNVKSPLYQIQVRGDSSEPVMIDVTVPDDAEPWETLDLYTWTGEEWQWVGGELYAEATGHEFIRARVTAVPETIVIAQAESIVPTVSTSVNPGDNAVAAAADVINEVNPTGLLLGSDGSLAGDPVGLPPQTGQDTYAVLPTLRNWAPDGTINRGGLANLLTNSDTRGAHIANIVQLCVERDFAGVVVDYQGVEPGERDAYASFISALADSLHAEELLLNVVVEPPAPSNDSWDTDGYDWLQIGAIADAVHVPFPADPTAYVEGGQAQQLLDWATAQISRYKLRMVVSSLSAERGSETVDYISLEDALAPFGNVTVLGDVSQVGTGSWVEFGLDGHLSSIMPQETAGTYRLEYAADDGSIHTVWLGTATSLAAKLRWAHRYHLGGTVVADMLDPGNGTGIVNAVAGYRVASARSQDPGQQMQIVWTVVNGTAAIDQQTTSLTEPGYTWVVLASPGEYVVRATVAGFDHGSIPVIVTEPEATDAITDTNGIPAADAPITPTSSVDANCLGGRYVADVTIPDNTQLEKWEEFVKTWSIRNTGTCDWPADTVLIQVHSQLGGPESVPVGAVAVGETVEISIDLVAPGDDGVFDGQWNLRTGDIDVRGSGLTTVIRVGEGRQSTGGSFELGGQTITLAHPSEMRYAGMSWVKFQVPWSPGMRGSEIAEMVRQSHANQLKVLLSISGSNEYPRSINFDAYVEFLREVAEQGPDGIEVWNEQNIDRKWPVGQVNPAAYVEQMLAPAYDAIKSVDPDILVISGAPSPTGFFGNCSPAGCDDALYVSAMLDAGAANYADCVGIHYNEGILPPSQTSGDPRGNSGHYTRYFWGMVNAYDDAFGGRQQLCFTELGYISPEGYGTLPDNFAWAADTSVDEQAAWLAEAASLSASSDKIRLLIVYNVDLTLWSEDDPQAGYAIIRPGVSCPACESLHDMMGSR
ncbi:MAG: hypothetical protein GY832_06950 [Chloroflexi bacterium]|nr:hypothetical protein [Chloroflexota bacterium]